MDSRSFREFAEDELENAWPPISAREANQKAADRILEGYQDLSDAGYDADLLEKQDSIRYDGFGWPFGHDAIRWAIWVKIYQGRAIKRYARGDLIKVGDEIGYVQWWGRPGKKNNIVKASRKKAIKGGNPHIYVWFHNSDYSKERWEWVKVKLAD